ncbi:putative chromatin-remodeling complex ATPase chain [Apostasia shenzhenica]|uniref:Putative chromatin-remodeling complex ATPase chain n=1 Tax=Apostasia shenzhenica TaxID=1088818 RepID=A0A2I0A6C7_9ASPA|nr:putative chromatin-remodeling complex ATPase chain [Apostasia shenzhenica]
MQAAVVARTWLVIAIRACALAHLCAWLAHYAMPLPTCACLRPTSCPPARCPLSPALQTHGLRVILLNWDTRVAAAQAIGAISENVKHTSCSELFASIETEILEAGLCYVSNDIRMDPKNLSVPLVLGTDIGFDSGTSISKQFRIGFSPLAFQKQFQEYDVANDSSKNPAERLARQKQSLRRRLGLDVCEQFMDFSDMIKDEDLLSQKGHSSGNGLFNGYHASKSGQNIHQLVATMVPRFRPRRLSAREINLLKRKAKVNAKDYTKYLLEDDELDIVSSQHPVASRGAEDQTKNTDLVDIVVDEDHNEHDEGGKWPFQHFVEQLIYDMFDSTWEVRHGSIMALREVLTHQGAYAGVFYPDLSSDISWFVDVDDSNYVEPMKDTQGIDLNMQFALDEHESELKRRKSDNESICADSKLESILVDIKHDAVTSVEGELCNASSGDTEDMHVKGEMGSFTDRFSCQYDMENVASLGSSFGDSISIPKINFVPNIPRNSKLMKMIKLARYSWRKNWEFLQDCAIRLLCILSLDRFGDYVADQVVAPVRETCAQALGVVLRHMHPSVVLETLKVLLQMQCCQEWEVRHGCLLGIKYLVAVRKEMLQDLLVYVLPACKAGLEDTDDDVRAVAAESLIPAASYIVLLGDETLHSIVMLLWDILLDLDDLSPSTSSVMNLLSEIYSQPEMVPKMLENLKIVGKEELDLNKLSQAEYHADVTKYVDNPYVLSTLTPRLWPFMRHSITSVRHSAIRTLERLLEVGYQRSSSDSLNNGFWPTAILGDALRIVFQNMLLESNDDILHCSERVWRLLLQCPEQDLEASATLYFSSWIQLAATPFGSPLDATNMFWPVALPRKSHFKAAAKMRVVKIENEFDASPAFEAANANMLQEKKIDTSVVSTKIIVGADTEKSVTQTRVVTASALGIFVSKLPESSLPVVINSLWNDLTSLSGVQRQVPSMVLIAWFRELQSTNRCGQESLPSDLEHVKNWLLDLLACSDPSFPTKDSLLPYAELSRTYAKMRNEANLLYQLAELFSAFQNLISMMNVSWDNLGIDEAIGLASKLSVPYDSRIIDKSSLNDLESAKQRLLSTTGYLKCVQNNLHITVSAMIAAAVVWMSDLPAKLNPIILPLMASVKREQEEILQQMAAEALVELMFRCVGRKPSPNDKLIKNLCSLSCMDTSETPQSALINSIDVIEDQNLLFFGKASSIQKTRVQVLSTNEDRAKVEGFISRRGAELALKHLCDKFGSSLFDKLPKLWGCLTEVLKPTLSDDKRQILEALDNSESGDPQDLINNIQVIRSVAPLVAEPLKPRLLTLLPSVLGCLRHCHVAVRLAASRCITSVAKSMKAGVMGVIIEKVVPMLADSLSVHARQGAGMLVTLLVQGLGVELVPYAPLLVVPLLRCMSDCDHAVRQSVTHSFAALVPLLPLARGLPPPVGLSQSLSRPAEDAQFLEQLLDNSHIDDYKLPVDIRVTLRRYQQDGINWLSFLRRFKLHGILCDDMGLGKTLQASAIVASDIVEQRSCANGKDPVSLIICPSTLIGHWAYEIEKYIDKSVMITLQYCGSAQERNLLRGQFDKCNIIIASYDIVRKDIDFLGKLVWNYCILDEGHIIKNSKSKITLSVKQLKAEHRLILSGTPVQNNVLELWSLFDFLMPGFLGTERQFQSTYGKPLLAVKDSKCSAKEAEAGVLAMEALHKQVMPFLLRRTKDEVLSDLPEKIIQDRYCDLSPLQLKLYEQFASSDAKKEVSTLVTETEAISEAVETKTVKATSHVFQALQYLLKLCSHPLLVIGDKPTDTQKALFSDIIPGCNDLLSELHELHHSPKLVALKEILEECGIGSDTLTSEATVLTGHHRVLIFAQRKSFLDMIERDLFDSRMKSVTYLRLDGSVEPDKRFEIVKTFNSDPTIDVLLLTTHVGGLGLNLTSADTLIFMEHDWNPMKDHQAMDRAHRLGQRKVVNVHRLIMRGTLEEKVMSLQKFKISVANAIINAENASLKTMNTDQLLDLFTPASASRKVSGASTSSSGSLEEDLKTSGKKGLKAILNGLEELWDQSQYADEYNLSHFLEKLNG